MSRRTARRQAFLTLFQSDVNGRPVDWALDRWRECRGTLDDYALRLAHGVEEREFELDEILSEVSVGWPVHRMSAVDRTVLRLGLYEMLYMDDVPPDVAINEAMELATGYSSEESPSFVGGVLRGAGSRMVRDG